MANQGDPKVLPQRRAGLCLWDLAPRAHVAWRGRPPPLLRCHPQSRSLRKRKYHHSPVAGEELKQLLEALIGPKHNTRAVLSTYPFLFLLSLGGVDDFRFLAPPQLTQHKAHAALHLRFSVYLQIIHPQ